jgi:SAM-dependent methyltransferase
MAPSILRYHEIAEAGSRILNPFTEAKLALLGALCRFGAADRLLDLACGKAELLSTWSSRYGIAGTGVDLSDLFLDAGHARAAELGVSDRVTLVKGDAGEYVEPGHDVVSCIGATWIGGGLVGTLRLMRRSVRPGGLLLVGEPFWHAEPPDEAYAGSYGKRGDFVTLAGTHDRFTEAGCELVEMVLADHDSWDRYAAAQWFAVERWLAENPDHEDAPWMAEMVRDARREYLAYGRRYFGWGVFVLRAPR